MFTFSMPPAEILPSAIAAWLIALLVPAALLAYLFSAVLEAGGKPFQLKLAGQFAEMGLFLHVAAAVLLGAALAWLFSERPEIFQEHYSRLPLSMGILLGASLLVSACSAASRARSGRPGPAHLLLSYLNALLFFSVPLICGTIFRYLVYPASNLPDYNVFSVVSELLINIPDAPEFWLAFGFTCLNSLCAAGMFGVAWLFLRRNKDDFGRDYYKYALHRASALALGGGLAGLALSALVFFYPQGIQAHPPALGQVPSPELIGLGYALMFIACALWTVIRLSQLPLRHKAGGFAALACAGAAIFIHTLNFLQSIPTP